MRHAELKAKIDQLVNKDYENHDVFYKHDFHKPILNNLTKFEDVTAETVEAALNLFTIDRMWLAEVVEEAMKIKPTKTLFKLYKIMTIVDEHMDYDSSLYPKGNDEIYGTNNHP
jgi:hypothetical protein